MMMMKMSADVGANDPAWMDVLIDVLMSLLSRDDNSVPRVIVNLSFAQLVPHFTQPSSLQLITQVGSFHVILTIRLTSLDTYIAWHPTSDFNTTHFSLLAALESSAFYSSE